MRVNYVQDPQTGELEILEESHYYPFGLQHTDYNTRQMDIKREEENNEKSLGDDAEPHIPVANRGYQYKFNGMELQTEFGVNIYDFGFRNYDPAIGRWMNVDPHAENYLSNTPYHFALNNPIYFIDPDGRDVEYNSASGTPNWGYIASISGGIPEGFMGGASSNAGEMISLQNQAINEANVQRIFNLIANAIAEAKKNTITFGDSSNLIIGPLSDGVVVPGSDGAALAQTINEMLNGCNSGDCTARGGPLNGKNLQNYIGFNSKGYIIRESSHGKFIEHENVRDIVQGQINQLTELGDILTAATLGSWAYTASAANTSLPSTVSVNRINIPVALVLSVLLTSEKISLNSDQRQLYQSLLNYYNSGNNGGLYEIKMHTANMVIPFSDKTTYSLYYSDGKHLGTITGNAFFGF